MEQSLNYKMNARRKRYIPGAMFGPFTFINVYSGKEVLNAENGIKNMIEVAVACRIMQLLYKECVSSKHKISIAVLSPHPAQVKCMREKLENHQQNNEFFKVRVGFVHDYQHGEADVVIISTVGNDEDNCCEVNTNLSNANVYLTWARHCLWILGDERTHLKKESIWKSLILEAKARECFFQAHENKDLAKVVFEVKKDLHQLDELLSGSRTLFQNTTWKVLFSSMFRASFSKIESSETKKLVLLMLLKLSSGWRPKGGSNTASVSESYCFELIEEFKVKGLHLICTKDVMKETHYTQVLKVWDILPFHEIEGVVRRLEEIIGMYTREYINHCKERCVQRGSEFREYPMKWPATFEIIQYKPNANRCDEKFKDDANRVENAKVSESLILMKFYSLSIGAVNTFIYGCDGSDLGIPFELTEQEKNVVSFDKSSFILGRSGTGKTTVLTMKLFQNEQLHHLACEGIHEVMDSKEEAKKNVLHQLFVTYSSKLCYAVRQQFNEWKRLTCGGGSSSQSSLTCIDDIDEMMLSESIPDKFINLPHDVYPLIITFHRFLLMLDGTVGTSYFKRFPNFRHFTYGNKTSTKRLDVLEQFMRLKDVTYQRFFSSYWPHFNNKLTKNLDPSTVYTEIMSVIKGGLIKANCPNGMLLRDDYVKLCDGRISIFDSQKREIIYSIFLQYENKKIENGDFDIADFVIDLHQRLEVEGYTGDIMDYVYVDEVQDLSMSQIMLFKYVCTNVHDGFAFSGDTAQAIAKGIHFRFEDIRSLFFKKFLLGSGKGNMSKIFQLSENFRTHAAVLNLSQSVINLLYHFFPLFVDALSPETSRICGDLPVLLETNMNNNNAIERIFGMNGDCSQLITGFGAEQVVLVRDESLKEKVIGIVGKNALVLTIMESKGLEFQDVLLYDFFTTSAFSNEWRIIYNYMKDKDLLTSSSTTLCSCFDMQKHAVLCGELKQLYVAITRARQRLWFFESSGFSEPIYDYWKKLSLVEVKQLSDSFADKMQNTSSKDEWRSRGVKLFRENNYRMAQMCFFKAGDEHSEKLAEAHYLREIGLNSRASQFEKEKYLKYAAELFIFVGKKELAADCLYAIKDFKTAGHIYKSESMWEKAGKCFYLAGCYELAVEEYEQAKEFATCLSVCTKAHLFEYGFNLLGRLGDCGDAGQEFLRKGANYFFLKEYFQSMIKFVRSFREKDDMRGFLTEKKCFDELLSLEKEWGNIEEFGKVMHKAAQYYFSIKDVQSMMKYVRSFCEKSEMQNFLAKRRCFDELISLEREWGNFEEVAKVIHKAAHYYCSIKDFRSMMKFVHSFSEKGEMRSFLAKRRRYDELIELEKEWGNFEEASKVARLKPDPVLEAELLRMSGLFKESALIILWHVFSNSPIFHKAEKPFTQKDKLLRMACSTARKDSDVFYRFVHEESKILSHGETKEELLEKGLEFIYCYKENASDMNLERVKTDHEIKKILKDVIDMMRLHLKSVNNLNKLLLLYEVCGELVEAAKIANGDEQSIEIDSTLSRLWYVFFGYLWACGTRAWPLKDFEHKAKLLDGAKLYVLNHPDSQDSALVHKEIHVLSCEEISLSHMCKYLTETPRESSLKIHFLISRRILDVHLGSHCKDYASIETWVEDETIEHLEELLLDNIVSVEGLIYFWKYWKEIICELINSSSHTDGPGCRTSKIYEDFLFNYFGVRKYDVDKYRGYVVLDVEAQWVKQTRAKLIRKGFLYIISPHKFSLAASRYWCSELLFVAEKVCEKFQSLQVYSMEKNLPIHLNTKILMCLFEVVKSLQNWNFGYSRKHASLIVRKYLQPCVDQLFFYVFHINWKYAHSKEMICLRRNEMFLDMLKDAININNKSMKGLTCRQLGKIAVVFFGYKLIGFCADIERKIGCSSLEWSDFLKNLMNSDGSVSKNEDLAISLHNILKETISAGWGRVNDYMSPGCFLYLMDRLLILSCCYRGYVFTTRSSFVEWLSYNEWGIGSIGGGATSSDTMKNIHHSLTSMVNGMLNSENELIEWLRSQKIKGTGVIVLCSGIEINCFSCFMLCKFRTRLS